MEINRQALENALATVKPALGNEKKKIEQTTSFAFIGNEVVTYNDSISIRTHVDGLDLEGAVDADSLYSLISKLKGETIVMEVSDNEILISCGKRKKSGLLFTDEMLLPLEEVGEIKKWKKLPKDWAKALLAVQGSCSTDTTKPLYTCVHVSGTVVEATDGYQVSIVEGEDVGVKSFLIPRESAVLIGNVNPKKIAMGEGWIHFKSFDNTIYSCRLFDEKYVDIKSALIDSGDEIQFPKGFEKALNTAGVFSEATSSDFVKLTFSKGKLKINSKNETGWYKETMKCKYSGDEISFMINPAMLHSILQRTHSGLYAKNRVMFKKDNFVYLAMLAVQDK